MIEKLPAVLGAVHPATAEGFKAFLVEANHMESRGYAFVALVRLEKSIASVYRHGGQKGAEPAASFGAFFDEI